MNRKKLILAILLVILPLSLISSYFRQPQQQRTDSLKYREGSVAGILKSATMTPGKDRTDDRRLHLEFLDSEMPRFAGYRRNIFQPIFKEEVKPLPFRPVPPITKLPLPPPLPPPPQLPVVEPSPIQQDIAKITFLGFLKKENQKTIFLSKDKDIFVVKKGNTIAGKYDVINVTDEALTIMPKAGGSEIIIPLVENRALNVPHQGK